MNTFFTIVAIFAVFNAFVALLKEDSSYKFFLLLAIFCAVMRLGY